MTSPVSRKQFLSAVPVSVVAMTLEPEAKPSDPHKNPDSPLTMEFIETRGEQKIRMDFRVDGEPSYMQFGLNVNWVDQSIPSHTADSFEEVAMQESYIDPEDLFALAAALRKVLDTIGVLKPYTGS